MPSDLLTIAEVRESVETGLSDGALGRIIDAQDAYILRLAGQHDPATTMVYSSEPRSLTSVWLPRPASSIASIEERFRIDGTWVVLDASLYLLTDGGRSIVLDDTRRAPLFIRITFTPIPENAERTQALINLVRLETQDTGLESERDDTFGYQSKDKLKARREIIEPLKQGYRRLA